LNAAQSPLAGLHKQEIDRCQAFPGLAAGARAQPAPAGLIGNVLSLMQNIGQARATTRTMRAMAAPCRRHRALSGNKWYCVPRNPPKSRREGSVSPGPGNEIRIAPPEPPGNPLDFFHGRP